MKNIEKYQEFEKIINEFLEFDIETEKIKDAFENNLPYVKNLNNKKIELNKIKDKLKEVKKLYPISIKQSKYQIFPFCDTYYKYTGINKRFFDKII